MLSYIRRRISLKYLLITTIPVALVFLALFIWMSRQQRNLIVEQVRKQAVILHKQIVLTRQWVSDHNYVLVAGGDEPPAAAAENLAPGPDFQGRAYTRVTPAGITRQLSNYAQRDELYTFNLTNIAGLNPDNHPDNFETRALQRFCQGALNGISRIEQKNSQAVYRYAAPLIIKASCLTCHADQNLSVGDVGGCISVYIPFEEARQAIRKNNLALLGTMGGLTVSMLTALFLLSHKLIFRPVGEIRQLTRRLQQEGVLEENGVAAAPPSPSLEPVRGDELKEVAGFCYLVDNLLKRRHGELEAKIDAATRKFAQTNRQLESANRELAKLNQAKSEFFTEISHELRTPLTAIKGAVDILARKNACSDGAYLEIIRKNTTHLTRTIIDFIDFSRIEAGRLELNRQSSSLSEVIREVIAAQQAVARQRNIEIRPPDVPALLVFMDAHRIYQVLANLLANALRYSPQNGRIDLELEHSETAVRVVVADQGPGIAPELQAHIFTKFYQIPESGGGSRGSSGIGLAICKGVVEAHGGQIGVSSRVGQGSRFYFSLPLGREDGSES